MKSTVDDSTVMSVHAQIKYKKSVWGVIKGFIEKNTWLGLEEFYENLSKALMVEYCLPPAKAKSRRSRKCSSLPMQMSTSSQPVHPPKHQHEKEITMQTATPMSGHSTRRISKVSEEENSTRSRRNETMSWIVVVLLVALIVFNVILYVKLWKLDDHNSENTKLEFLR